MTRIFPRPPATAFVVGSGLLGEIKSRLFDLERELAFWRSVLDNLADPAPPPGRASAAGERMLDETRRILSRVEASKMGLFQAPRRAFQSNVLAAVLNRSGAGLTTKARDVQRFFTDAGQREPNLHAVTAALSRLVKKRSVRRVAKGVYVGR